MVILVLGLVIFLGLHSTRVFAESLRAGGVLARYRVRVDGSDERLAIASIESCARQKLKS
jgi:uncharacterized membrane protein